MNRLSVFILTILLATTSPLMADQPEISADSSSGAPVFVPGRLLVKFRSEVTADRKGQVHGRKGTRLLRRFEGLSIDVIQAESSENVEEMLGRYLIDPEVVYAEPDYIVRIEHDGGTWPVIPDDPMFIEQWSLKNGGQTGGTPDADIDAGRAWKRTTGDSRVVVAVVDSGIDYTHEDLIPNLWVNDGEVPGNGIDDDGNGYVDDVYGANTYYNQNNGNVMDTLGHGTHVAGIIGAAGGNGIGVTGINWNVRIMTCRFIGPWGFGSISDAIDCLEYIRKMKERGENVVAVNHSWGFSGILQSLNDAVDAQPDVLQIAAAGNSNRDNDLLPYSPASIDLPNVLSVASTDHNDQKANSSSYGRRSVHLGAPGVDILSTLPEHTHWGASLYGLLSGTSMAAPHVTGVAALLKADRPTRDWSEIRNTILAGGEEVAGLSGKTLTGRRLSAYGAVSCRDGKYFGAGLHPTSFPVGMPVKLSALNIHCGHSTGEVIARVWTGEVIRLTDDGVGPDQQRQDGIFSASWTPSLPVGRIVFKSNQGEDVITAVDPVILSFPIPDATKDASFDYELKAEGGSGNYSWNLTEGALPEGLGLDPFSGRIQGIPSGTGTFNFGVTVADDAGRTGFQQFTMVSNLTKTGRTVVSLDP